MTKKFVQVKINIPTSNKSVIEYCDKLSAQRKLSARIIRLLSEDLSKKNGEGNNDIPKQHTGRTNRG